MPRSTVSRASFPALAGYTGNATTLQIVVGCFNGPQGTACTTAGGGGDREPDLRRARGAQRPDARRPPRSRPPGLLAGGRRNGSDAVTLDASDNGGIRRVEIVDLSGGAASSAARTTAPARAPTRGATCSPRLHEGLPEPQATRPCARPGWPPAGGRSRSASSTPPATSPSRGPTWSTSSRRRTAGRSTAAAPPTAARSPRTSRGKRKRHKTVGYRKRVRVTGRLLNSAGKPISGALLKILTRDRRSGAPLRPPLVDDHEVRRLLQGPGARPARRGSCRWRGRRTSATPARRRAPT